MHCPYCKYTVELREDRLKEHVRKVHPSARLAGPGKPKRPRAKSAGDPTTRQRSVPPSTDREAPELLRGLPDTPTGPASESAAVRARLGYVARVSGALLSRAFSFGERGVLFTGDGPYEAHRLALLLPDAAGAWMDGEDPGQSSFYLVVGRNGYYGDRMKRAVTSGG